MPRVAFIFCTWALFLFSFFFFFFKLFFYSVFVCLVFGCRCVVILCPGFCFFESCLGHQVPVVLMFCSLSVLYFCARYLWAGVFILFTLTIQSCLFASIIYIISSSKS